MDDNKRRDIDLSSFDLSQFKEYFEEEDAQRAAEEKERKERAAKEEAERLAAQEEAVRLEIAEKRRREKELTEKREAAMKAEREAREKEEARRAAEKAAAAAMAAKRAEEARQKSNLEASAKLREQAEAENTLSPESSPTKQKPDESESQFKKFASILDIEDLKSNTEDDKDNEEDDEITGFLVDKDKTKSRLFTALCVVLCVAFIACAAFAAVNFFKAKYSDDDSSSASADTAAVSYNPYKNLKATYGNAEYPNAILSDLKPMYSRNDDLAGWLTIPGTAIDYPIVQSKNNTYYLNGKNAFNENARYGTPFLDYRCNTFDLSKNTIVYGHHMNNNMHFGSLDLFADVKNYKEHPIIKYETLTKSYTFKIYAAFYATTEASVDGGYVFEYYNPNMSTSNFSGYIDMLKQYALYTTEAGLKADDKIITLSTCTHVYDSLKSGGVDARLVVVGRLLRNGESESVNTDNVLVNSDYRRPQIWYDKNGKSNPYASSRKWTPSK